MGEREDLVDKLASHLRERGLTVAVAESLTGGAISTALAKGPESSEWFRGAVVAYSSEVKYDLLEVPDGPVVSEDAALAMAAGVCRLLGADLAVAVTGAGGPAPQDGAPPGTVWMALRDSRRGTTHSHLEKLDGPPEEVVDATTDLALVWLLAACEGATTA